LIYLLFNLLELIPTNLLQDASCFVRKAYIDKIHKLLKEHAVPSKFACAFALTAASDCVRDLKDVVRLWPC